ncbi:NTPase KAP family P-loop domain-containing protein 1 [Paramormyrops kingsleyae]|uniref:NTPase KAP family P-loop domain-containing protein 1 n=1 Tax=Paramormyrops kingsleyae TaxID=1676925 RepID=UPI003B976690
MKMTEEPPSDSVYAYALSKTLSRVPAPATVGLYSSCHSRIHMVLKSIESQMTKEAQENEHQNHRQSVADLFKVIFRLLFYQPVDRLDTKGNQRPKPARYIFVRFSAWHFAGSDILWAALVMRLYEAFHENFGKFLLSLYRVTQYTTPMNRIVSRCGTLEWRSKKCCCIPLWLLTLFVLLGILVGFPLIFCFSKEHMDAQDSNIELHTIQSFLIGIIGLPATYVISSVFLIVKNIFYNQYVNIKKMMDNEKVSSQLGFMNEVKKEMEILSYFISFMETFEKKKIRVVLEITHLDRCNPRRIVGVLDAINILLSDEGSPFISMLAVNPEVLAEQLNYAESCFSKEDRAHSFLNRLVTLAFTIPELCDSSKRNIIKRISSGHLELPDDIEDKPLSSSFEKYSEECHVILTERKDPEINLNEKDTENLIESVFQCIRDKCIFRKYIMGDTMSIRRIITSVRMSIIIMKTLGHDLPSAEHTAAWVVLANQWPCRLSWILQCMEDDKQNAEINQQSFDTSKTLWQVFSESRVELYMIRDRVRPLLEQDGDPELFEMFLKVNFTFTINDANRLKLSTVNLDHSIQRQLARIKGMSSLKDTVSQKTPIPLPVKAVINMSMEDICGELKKLKLPDLYVERVQKNMLDGCALVYSDNSEIQKMLEMPLGHWTAFAIHFLGVTPPAPSCLIAGEDKADVASPKSHISICSESSHIYRS